MLGVNIVFGPWELTFGLRRDPGEFEDEPEPEPEPEVLPFGFCITERADPAPDPVFRDTAPDWGDE